MGCPWPIMARAMGFKARYWHEQHGEVRDVSDYVSAQLEALAKACRTYDPARGTLRAYTNKFLDRACIDFHRGDHVTMEELEERSASYEMGDGGLLFKSRLKRLCTQNPALGVRAYEWLVLSAVEGYTQYEIAEQAGVSQPVVNDTLQRTKAFLREKLGGRNQ